MHVASAVLADLFVPLRDRSAEWTTRLDMIADAARFVYASTYYVGPDDYGFAYLDALGAAAERGVSTTLIVDRFGQWLGASAWTTAQRERIDEDFQTAAARGVDVVWTRPIQRVRRWVGGGHHVKIQITERGRALLGSSNISHHSFGSWGEFGALVGGQVARPLLSALHAVIPEPDPGHLALLPRTNGAGPAIPMSWWWCDPSADPTPLAPLRAGRGNPITDGLVDAVERAERSIAVTSFYFKPTAALRTALLDAARRGVAVEVYHSGPDALGGPETSWLAAAIDYPAWLDAGVAVHQVDGGEHSKLVLVDDRWAAFGSYNLDHAAHDVVAEAMLASAEPRVVAAVRAVIEELRRAPGTRRVPPGYRDHWPLRRRLRARMVSPLRRWV